MRSSFKMGSAVSLPVLVVFFFLVVTILIYAYQTSSQGSGEDGKEGLVPKRGDFKLYNYLLADVIVRIVKDGSVFERRIPSQKSAPVSKSEVSKFFGSENNVEIYVHPPTQPEKAIKYADYRPQSPSGERIKNLHIGMVTTRYVGDGWPLNQVSHASAATGGNPWILIHNFTQVPLELNHHIDIPPASRLKYHGAEGISGGVPLGTWFRDSSILKLYPDFQHLVPNSDLYYGMISDVKQPLVGPWQFRFSEEVDETQTMWPMEMGQL
jgi:hypothetical protein